MGQTSRLKYLQDAIGYILKGDVYIPLEWLRRKSMQRITRGTSVAVHSDFNPPAWLSSKDSLKIIQLGDKYLNTVADLTEGESVSFSPPEAFTSLEFTVTNVDNIAEFKLHIKRTEKSGNIKSETVSFVNGLYDDSFNHVPFSFQFNQPATSAEISVIHSDTDLSLSTPKRRLLSFLDSFEFPTKNNTLSESAPAISDQPQLSVPSVRPHEPDDPPILLISVDTLRYDYLEEFEPVVNALGNNAKIPAEPRTQGFFTTPSHASMFTGVHPGDHHHVTSAPDLSPPISTELDTVGELLSLNQYKCSGLVSHTRLLPNYGFGRGFSRYELDNKKATSWMQPEGNARGLVDTIRQWIDEDMECGSEKLFYFLHIFDPHSPFYPPLPIVNHYDIDFATIEAYLDQVDMTTADENYLELLKYGVDIDESILQKVKEVYRISVKYTATQLAHLFDYLQEKGLLSDMLVIITGDHGYEFAERGFVGAKTLNDANIRQGMIIKPPADADWDVPDAVDTIDILPTLMHTIGEEIPTQCQGTPWQLADDEYEDRPRFYERIRSNWYNVAVEKDGIKAIFTYESNLPDRPTANQLSAGPSNEEYYNLEDIRSGEYSDCGTSLSATQKGNLRKLAEKFVSQDSVIKHESKEFMSPDQETEEQMRLLGYR